MTKQRAKGTQEELSQEFNEFIEGMSPKMDAIMRWALSKEGQDEIKKGRITRAKALKKIRESMQD